jgi:DNA segregation ATPase FtsK/SpoIIIE-like protein
VVTSTWRKYPEWEQCLRKAGLRSCIKILGATSLPTKDRATEISDYLADHAEIEAYLIFDDDESLLKNENEDTSELGALFDEKGVHSDNLVLCNKEHGFGEEEYTMAVALHFRQKYRLSKDISRISANKADSNGLNNAAIELLYVAGELTTAFLQRAFGIGYGRATEIIDFLVKNKILIITNKKGQIKYLPLMEYEEAKSKL